MRPRFTILTLAAALALDDRDGKVIWRYDLKRRVGSAPIAPGASSSSGSATEPLGDAD